MFNGWQEGMGLTVITATSNPRPFVHSLQPDYVVRLSSSSHSSVVTGSANLFERCGLGAGRRPDYNVLPKTRVICCISSHFGPKYIGVYRGRKRFQRGLMLLCNGGDEELVRVTRCTQKHYGNLCDDDAVLDGFLVYAAA